nr:MAG TPA: cathepsin L [Caudoviricetes sp.]
MCEYHRIAYYYIPWVLSLLCSHTFYKVIPYWIIRNKWCP